MNALIDFTALYLISDGEAGDERGRTRGGSAEDTIYFPRLRRLCLRSASSIPSTILTPFVLAFPSLTHLDLSCTRATPELLDGLANAPRMRLVSLSLARCPRLTSDSVMNLLVHGYSTRGLHQLNLFGDVTCPFPLKEEDLFRIVKHAPCFLSGLLTYLDLSSNPVTPAILDAFADQPSLRSLGLSYIYDLELKTIAKFLGSKAINVEVLTIVSTAPELSPSAPLRESMIALHSHMIQPLCNIPFSMDPEPLPSKTRLRVLELKSHMLKNLSSTSHGDWKVIRSSGARGWYVDTTCGWVAEGPEGAVLKRNLPREHPLRRGLEQLAQSDGNVGTGIGWHTRKMEVLHGHGLLGREDGLYGAVSYAFAG